MSRRRQHLLSWSLLLAGAVLALVWFAFSPLLFDRTVDEAPPQLSDLVAATPPAPLTDATAPEEQRAAQMRAAADKPNVVVNEFMPPMDEIPPDALSMRRGTLTGADQAHQAEGQVRFYQTEFGDGLLRLEEFRVTNGPDLVVLLAKHPQPASAEDIAQGHLVLGELKGNLGNQNYSISGRDDLGEYQSAVIYCRLFHVVFAVAQLGPAEAAETEHSDDLS